MGWTMLTVRAAPMLPKCSVRTQIKFKIKRPHYVIGSQIRLEIQFQDCTNSSCGSVSDKPVTVIQSRSVISIMS